MNNTQIEFDWENIINKRFIELVENKDRYLILYGGRGSSKSDFAAKKLIYRCLKEDYFRCILIRQTYSSIKDTSYDQLKETIIEWGLEDYFEFKIQPLEIICVNGNKFVARGCDDITKLKSLKDFSATWVEEDFLNESDFITITTGIRTTKADYLQEIFTINPEVSGDYKEHWFYKRFFDGKIEKSFSDTKTVVIDSERSANITYTVHHSTYRDNIYIPNEFIASLMDMKITNPYYYQIYCEGNWGNKTSSGLCYNSFNRSQHCNSNINYNPDKPLHISFDFNVKPYVSLIISQVYDNAIHIIDSIAAEYPNNSTRGLCQIFSNRYLTHTSGLFIYGDASGRNESTTSEQGVNNYTIIQNELGDFHPELIIPVKNPNIKARLNFINEIFFNNYNGLSILINDEKCPQLINDLLFQKTDKDGGKLKELTTKTRNGKSTTYQKYGHFSDCLDYLIIQIFIDNYNSYHNGNINYTRVTGANEINETFNY